MSTVEGVNERLAKLTSAGVSVWLDQIRRSLIESGELARMVEEESLRGVTSNPSIFEKAILGSNDYDDELEEMARQELSAQEMYDRIAVKDVQLAADVLRSVWEESGRRDGFVSLEVPADVAHDAERTIEAARTYWKAVHRPNVMIKIPGTPEGVGAIEQAIYEGININVTLLFAVEAYETVAEAYIRGTRAPPGRGTHARRELGGQLLRLPGRHQRRQEAREARTQRPRRHRGARQRAGRLPPVQGDLLRPALGGAAPRRCGRAAAAVGLDRNEGPGLLGHVVRRGARGRPHGEHDADGHAARRGRPRRIEGPHGRAGPRRRRSRRCARRGST